VVDGRVQNGVIALNGDVRVSGVVEDNVVALNGRVVVAESGRLQGDVVSAPPARGR
jgi:cytoskeletal protein CcmA (bactofilin family)